MGFPLRQDGYDFSKGVKWLVDTASFLKFHKIKQIIYLPGKPSDKQTIEQRNGLAETAT